MSTTNCPIAALMLPGNQSPAPYSVYTAPNMPKPGDDFVQAAKNLMGPDGPIEECVNDLYWAALGSPTNDQFKKFWKLLVKYKNKMLEVDFISGHRWRTEEKVALTDVAHGPAPADVMIIGKMPGFDDHRNGRNLTGHSMEILLEAVEELDSTDEFGRETQIHEWYVTNLIKFPHPDKKSSTIPMGWFKDCAPLTHLELRIVRPKYILCLGSEATQFILGKQATLTSTAGHVFDYEIPLHLTSADDPIIHTAKVVTCTHPAAVARSMDAYPMLLEQVRLFRKLIMGDSVSREEHDLDHRVITCVGQLNNIVDEVIKETPNGAVIAVDCEWHGEYPTEKGAYLRTIQFSHKGKFGACVVLRSQGGQVRFCKDSEEIAPPLGADVVGDVSLALEPLKRLFTSTKERPVRVVGHFFRADLPWLINFGLDLRPQHSAPPSATEANQDPGWIRTIFEGGMDTGLAAHAHTEVGPFKLEILASHLLGTPRYDKELHKWKVEYCRTNKMNSDDLEGYGDCPSEILHPYACYDVDVTRRLFDVFNGVNGQPGLLDRDRFGNCSREAFWVSQRASPAFLEMELNGIMLDWDRAETLTQLFMAAQAQHECELREQIKWDGFKASSDLHRREFLFGEQYNRIPDPNDATQFKRFRPPEGISLGLTPLMSTGKKKRPWSELVARYESDDHRPSCDKETLSILSAHNPLVKKLKSIRVLGQVLQSVLRRPEIDGAQETMVDEDGNHVYSKGLMGVVCADERIRTHFFQTKETGRASSSRPPLQNISKSKEDEYKSMLGARYNHPLRSVLRAAPGHVLIEADYSGAEVLGMAILSGDANLIEHAVRSTLKKTDPNFYDLHSNIAVETFGLNCKPTKKGLQSIGMEHLRTAAKARFFGYAYGQGAEAAVRKAMEEIGGAVTIELEQMETLTEGLEKKYPRLRSFFSACRARVFEPGWICNCFGRFRRFRPTNDRQANGELERQAMNFPVQSLVADAVSRALDHLYYYRETHPDVSYRLVLQIHDAVVLEVPIAHISKVWDEVLPECMIHQVPLYPCNLDGLPLGTGPYYFGIGKEICVNWGETLDREEALAMGIPEHVLED